MKHFDLFSSDDEDLDDIDELFTHLEVYQPPSDFVDRVMKSVEQITPPWLQPEQSTEDPETDEGLVFHHEHMQPS